MPLHEYESQEALELLMTKLRSRDEELAAEIQAAIDAGKDVAETEPIPGRRKRHVYRRTIPFSNEEALQVAVTALQAYFVEQPMFVDAAAAEFAQAAIGIPIGRQTFSPITLEKHEAVSLDKQGEEKRIEIEIQTETQIARAGEETLPLVRVPTGTIEEQRQQINRLRELVNFIER
jgi:hypothetical protein